MIDWGQVSELRGEIGAEDFDEVVELFLEEVGSTVAALTESGASALDLEAQLHCLKGSALNLGFRDLAELCQSGETAARGGAAETIDLDRIARCYDSSKKLFLSELASQFAA